MTLTEFLLERIAEDEADLDDARSHWMHGDDRHYLREFHQQFNADDMRVDVGYGRARAECEAKRRIIAELDPWVCKPDAAPGAIGCRDDTVLGLLALPYADHPDYREEWDL